MGAQKMISFMFFKYLKHAYAMLMVTTINQKEICQKVYFAENSLITS